MRFLTCFAGLITVVHVDDRDPALEFDVVRQRRVQVHFVYGQLEGHLLDRAFGREQSHCTGDTKVTRISITIILCVCVCARVCHLNSRVTFGHVKNKTQEVKEKPRRYTQWNLRHTRDVRCVRRIKTYVYDPSGSSRARETVSVRNSRRNCQVVLTTSCSADS